MSPFHENQVCSPPPLSLSLTHSLSLPPSSPLSLIQDGHMLGYAFVQFSSFFEAMNAITAVNGTEIKGDYFNTRMLRVSRYLISMVLQEE